MNKKKIIISVIIAIIVIASLWIIIFTGSEGEEEQKKTSGGSSFVDNGGKAPSKLETDEKDVTKAVADELYSFIPKMYYEEIAPFTSVFMMDAAINQIMEEDKDLSEENVNERVKEIFGNDAKIDKKEVSSPDISKSIYYYSEESKSYAVVPLGYGGIFEMQILKNVTETDEYYYVYTYALGGIYYFDDEAVVETFDEETEFYDEEFTDEEFNQPIDENGKVRVIIGDKDGYDLVHVFDNIKDIYNEKIWIANYENKMPVFRYTLKKSEKTYYLTEVEQINY